MIKKYLKNGFTLAEILIVIAIVALIGTVLVAIFTNTLRGSNKSQILSAMKQNSQAVLDSMDKVIRGADNVVCPRIGSSDTMVILKDGTYSRYRIARGNVDGLPSGLAPAVCIGLGKNGCIILDNPTPSPSETDPQVFIDRICSSTDPMSSAQTQILTDTNSVTGVLVQSGSFSVSNSAGFKAIATVNFILQPGVGVPQAIADQIDPVTYQTMIELR